MEVKFKESNIPGDFAKAIAKQGSLIGAPYVDYVAKVLFVGVSQCLAENKDKSIPKAVVFKGIDGTFLAAAKVEYIKNEDDPSNPSSGQWSYVWTTNEDDIKDCQQIDVGNSLIMHFFTTAAFDLYNMKFVDNATCILMMTTMVEMLINWAKENTKEGSPASIELDGVFKVMGEVEDGKIYVAIVPSGDMKVLIKDDSAIQEA